MRWLELSVTVDVEAIEAVSEILGRVADGTAVHPIALLRDPNDELAARDDPAAGYVVTAHVSDGPAAAGQVEAVERALWHLQAFGLRPVGALRVRSVDDAGWADAWREHYVAQRVGRVVIAPSWAKEPLGDGEVQVVLDPGMAFGTGLHPTTRACIAFLGDLDPMPPAMLDVGCGSGILALAALRLGVARAVGLDTDPVAVEATRANAERNGLAGRLEARQGTLPETPDDRYPLITANLVAAILVELAPRLAAHLAPGGVLFAAGIIAPRAEEVAAAMKAAGLLAIDRIDDGEWVSLRLGHVA